MTSRATIGAQRRFLEKDFARLERIVQNTWAYTSGDSILLRPSITTCWPTINAAIQDMPDCIPDAIASVLKVRQSIWRTDELTEVQLHHAVKKVDLVENYLHWYFSDKQKEGSQ